MLSCHFTNLLSHAFDGINMTQGIYGYVDFVLHRQLDDIFINSMRKLHVVQSVSKLLQFLFDNSQWNQFEQDITMFHGSINI